MKCIVQVCEILDKKNGVIHLGKKQLMSGASAPLSFFLRMRQSDTVSAVVCPQIYDLICKRPIEQLH